MLPSLDDTIAAIATALGEGGIGVVRISGPEAEDIAKKVFRTQNAEHRTQELQSHKAAHGWVIDPHTQAAVDEGVLLYFKAPNSYTGEDVIEISCHGSSAILKKVLCETIAAGARLAGKGEFTKRAFLNGKIDLAQAEAVIDLIKARTEESAALAVKQLSGRLSEEVNALRQSLIGILAEVEASIDFPDELEGLEGKKLADKIEPLIHKIIRLLATANFGKIMREGLATVIIGKPNVGKSSLLNALLKEERAIVTDIPGTTRDTIEEYVNIDGIPLKIVDTAGIRHPKDKIEEFGIERAKQEIAKAELILAVVDGAEGLTSEDQGIFSEIGNRQSIIVINKTDMGIRIKEDSLPDLPQVRISALYGQGIKALEGTILGLINKGRNGAEEGRVVINLRHQECLLRAKEALERVAVASQKDMAADVVAIDIKEAIGALGEVTGESITDEVLDRIFERFCVGK